MWPFIITYSQHTGNCTQSPLGELRNWEPLLYYSFQWGYFFQCTLIVILAANNWKKSNSNTVKILLLVLTLSIAFTYGKNWILDENEDWTPVLMVSNWTLLKPSFWFLTTRDSLSINCTKSKLVVLFSCAK